MWPQLIGGFQPNRHSWALDRHEICVLRWRHFLFSLSFWVKNWTNSSARGNRNKISPSRWTPKIGTDRALGNDESCKWSIQAPKVKLKYSIKGKRIQSEDSLCSLHSITLTRLLTVLFIIKPRMVLRILCQFYPILVLIATLFFLIYFMWAHLFGSMKDDEECDDDHTVIGDSSAEGGDKENWSVGETIQICARMLS